MTRESITNEKQNGNAKKSNGCKGPKKESCKSTTPPNSGQSGTEHTGTVRHREHQRRHILSQKRGSISTLTGTGGLECQRQRVIKARVQGCKSGLSSQRTSMPQLKSFGMKRIGLGSLLPTLPLFSFIL